MLALSIALLLGFVLLLAFFGLRFTRMLGSHQEQKTAIEAAALAAANSISRIVVLDPVLGYVGLSDGAPRGRRTAAQDGFGLPVRGINTVLATIRLDMILADKTANPTMLEFARRDYESAMSAKDRLVRALKDSIAPSSVGEQDIEGNTVSPYEEAIRAYETNVVRLQGGASRLLPGSLRLTLGSVKGLPTGTPVPSPSTMASIGTDGQEGGFYRSDVNVPYRDLAFVFAAVSSQTVLCDFRQFSMEAEGLPYVIPSVVRAEADHEFINKDEQGRTLKHVVHASACAQPGAASTERAGQGALVLEFSDGKISELNTPAEILTDPGLNAVTMNLYSVANGDHPSAGASLVPLSTPPPVIGFNPPAALAYDKALYDWLKRGGPGVNIQSYIDMQTDPIAPPVAPDVGFMTMYTFGSGSQSGAIIRRTLATNNVYALSSHKQLVGVTVKEVAAKSTGYTYDALLQDQVYDTNPNTGGIHGGEPVVDSRLSTNPEITSSTVATVIAPGKPLAKKPVFGWDGKAGGWSFALYKKAGQPGTIWARHNRPETFGPLPSTTKLGELRGTYLASGLAVNLSFHKVIKALPDDN